MGYVTRFTPHAQRQMLKVPRADALRILRRLTELQLAMNTGDTTAFDLKALQGHSARWRLRIGDYRVDDRRHQSPVGRLDDPRGRRRYAGPYH